MGSPDEAACFVYCQDRFPAGKDQHLAVVNCALEVMCSPPCTLYPQDYELCRAFMNNGDCTGYQKACEADPRCTTYRDCVKFCGSIAACTACDDTADATGVRGGEAEGEVAAERVADHVDVVELQVVEQRGAVFDHVDKAQRTFDMGAARAAIVGHDQGERFGQLGDEVIPHPARPPEAGNQQQRGSVSDLLEVTANI